MHEFSSLESFTLLSLLCCAVAYFWSHFAYLRTTLVGLPLPPGPKANWMGNVDLPRFRPWLTYEQWKDVYGDLIYIRVFGNPILVLNSAAVASDLLERRGGKYSSRPIRTMIVELPLPQWHPLQIQETHALCRRLLNNPQEFRHYIRKTAAGLVLKMTYGPGVGTGDEYIVLADKALASLAQAGIFGTYLVDYLPFLKYAPSCFAFRRKASEWRKLTRAMLDTPFDTVKKELEQGTASKCLVTEELERLARGSGPKDESIVKNSAISTFFLMMTLHPNLQARGQKEMDKVIGHGHRLPLFTDRPELPFIDYICYELLRYAPVTPLGLAHYITEDDVYKGYRLPKVFLPNVWAMLHDPEMYPEPLEFNPERFAPENQANGLNQIPDPAFGFGRRLVLICPGKFLAFDTMWILVATLLAVYDISKEADQSGRIKTPVAELFTPNSLSHPMPFTCTITPRSPAARQLIVQTEIES
ncbi:cytochrome P450 [Mycena polygramma]|nr:cytochrome P450 [Mycena polygramma]